MEFLGPTLLLYFFLAAVAVAAFPLSVTVCGWFIVKCVRAMFSEQVMQSMIREPVFHFFWMLLAIPCGIYVMRGFSFVISRISTG